MAFLLILTSGWLFFRTGGQFVTVSEGPLSGDLLRSLANPRILLPLAGSLMGFLGGLIVFFGGAGGAAIAMIGGVLSAGLSLYLGQSLELQEMRFWENEAVVSVTMLVLAGTAALIGRS
ncbi:MAG: hypothetical protein SGJ21_16120 [Alphaproteobacteria bacterium]|nr:hypothetical protein [Alphaproteobacteria bacterium]